MICLGYAGVNTLLPSASQTFRIRNYSVQKMLEVAHSNLSSLENILKWNLEHEIFIFRITSHLIPYGSNIVNSGIWRKELKDEFRRIGEYIRENGMIVSMHPGQYSVLNTPNEDYWKNTLADLEYHNSVLELMGLNQSHRIVIHGGGIYGNKTESIKLLKQRLNNLPQDIRVRMTLENDERAFSAEDILEICQEMKIPATLDVFHHQILPSLENLSIREILKLFSKTWKRERQAIHYSNQATGKRKGAHSETVDVAQFGKFYEQIKDLELDIMLEVKDKQDSVLKIRKALADS